MHLKNIILTSAILCVAIVSSFTAFSQEKGDMKEKNKAIIKSWIEARNTHDLEAALSFWSDDWQKRVTKGFNGTTESFPDVQITIEELLADENKVVLSWTFDATHKGLFHGVPGTGKTVKWVGVDIYTITDGKISNIYRASDNSELMRQIKGE